MIDANLEVLEKDLLDRITNFKTRANDNKKRAGRVILLTGIISALTTVFIGVSSIISGSNPHYSKLLSIFALITSSAVPVIQGWDAFFNHKKLWSQYRGSLNRLHDLDTDLKHLKKNLQDEKQEANQGLVNELYLRYKSILQEANRTWVDMREEMHTSTSNRQEDKK